MLVHREVEAVREVPEDPREDPAQVVELVIVHQEPTALAADRARIGPEVTVLGALLQHRREDPTP